jgi:hypothetical protein
LDNPQGKPTTLSKEEIINNHKSALSSFGLSMKDEDYDVPLYYWIPMQNYTSVDANKVMSRELPSVLPSLFLTF